MRFYIVEIIDEAILGRTSGKYAEKTVDGPFDDYHTAMEQKLKYYTSMGCVYYTIRKGSQLPKETSKQYCFADADREFGEK